MNITETDRHVDEMNRLIELSEHVSIGLIRLTRTQNILNLISVFCVLMLPVITLYGQTLYEIKIFSVFTLITIVDILIGVSLVYQIFKLKDSIDRERHVLKELLELTFPYKEAYYKDFSPITRAIFDMRLSRISFDVGSYKRSKEESKTEVISDTISDMFRKAAAI